MKALSVLALIALSGAHPLTAQSVRPPADQTHERNLPPPSIGVLIGLDRLDDTQIPRPEIKASLDQKKSAAYDRQWGENEKNGKTGPVRYDTTPEESPYATVWIQWTSTGANVRLLRDIILPRKDGFWRFGINHSSVRTSDNNNDQDFFWTAPLGTVPTLTRAKDVDAASQQSTRRLTYIGPDYFSYRELDQSTGGTYGEGAFASVRSLDEFARKSPTETDYGYDHRGVPLTKVFGPGVEPDFKEITKLGVSEDSEQTESEAAPGSDDDLHCSGYQTSETDWYVFHKQGAWVASLALHSTGPGLCGRQTDWKPLASRLPTSMVGHDPAPVAWELLVKAFPGIRHAFASPKADWIVVLTRNQVYLVPMKGNSLGKPVVSAKIPYGIPVMAQWAIGKYVAIWDGQLSKLPAPNDDVNFLTPDEPQN